MPSHLPTSAQSAPHPRLGEVVKRHLTSTWAQGLHAHTQLAFDRLHTLIALEPRNIVLDSGCGTGWASQLLAQSYPNHWIIGIDRSESRLSRAPKMPNNVHLIRAELADFWRLVLKANWTVTDHHVLYPNPYPKAAHLKKRWHGHPVWPDLLSVGQRLIMRTNASVYAQEWAMALALSGQASIDVRELNASEVLASPISAFEKKYAQSAHPLFEVTSCRQPVIPTRPDLDLP